MKIFYLVCFILLSVSSVTAQGDSIKNFLRVNKEFCTGGQPSLEHLEKLKADGVKTIINLRQPTEYAAAEEEAKAKAVGLRYFNIPVSPTEPKDEQATQFLKLTDDPENRPAFIHCRSAARVAAFWMIRRVLRDGWKIEDALKEAEKIGLGDHPALSEFARKYIERHRLNRGDEMRRSARGAALFECRHHTDDEIVVRTVSHLIAGFTIPDREWFPIRTKQSLGPRS